MHTATHMLRTGQRGALFQAQMALRDLRNSFQRIGLAWSLAAHDVGSRYRGSILGPFWITLSWGSGSSTRTCSRFPCISSYPTSPWASSSSG